MRHRAAQLGGEVIWPAAQPHGCVVRLRAPLEHLEHLEHNGAAV
jgi:hypothetical protein